MARSGSSLRCNAFIGRFVFLGALLPSAREACALPQSFRLLDDSFAYTGDVPSPHLIEGSDGLLYGACEAGGNSSSGILFKTYRDGGDLTKIFDFDGTTNGGQPNGVCQGNDGALYGTTHSGGANGCGTIFRVNTDGTGFTVLLDFDLGVTGGNPDAALIQATDGFLYGTTEVGGWTGDGTCFRLWPDGTSFAVLWTFDGNATGASPMAGLIQANDGNFYGTTSAGGANGDGTVFKLVVSSFGGWLFSLVTDLMSFDRLTSGDTPTSEVLQGSDGMIYGTASSDGPAPVGADGTVYKLNTDGSGFTVIAALTNYHPDPGSHPAALVQAPDGTLYGAAESGGSIFGGGTIFSLQTDGSGLQSFHDFQNGAYDGMTPWGLLLARDGNIYGTTTHGFSGNPDAFGTLFSVMYQLPAIWRNYGAGLAGTLGIPGFTSNADPILGQTIQLSIDNSRGAATSGTLFLGLSQTLIPIKGGDLLVGNVFAYLPLAIAVPNDVLNGSLPKDPSLIGLELDLQVLEADAGAVKGLSFTPGLQLILGF